MEDHDRRESEPGPACPGSHPSQAASAYPAPDQLTLGFQSYIGTDPYDPWWQNDEQTFYTPYMPPFATPPLHDAFPGAWNAFAGAPGAWPTSSQDRFGGTSVPQYDYGGGTLFYGQIGTPIQNYQGGTPIQAHLHPPPFPTQNNNPDTTSFTVGSSRGNNGFGFRPKPPGSTDPTDLTPGDRAHEQGDPNGKPEPTPSQNIDTSPQYWQQLADKPVYGEEEEDDKLVDLGGASAGDSSNSAFVSAVLMRPWKGACFQCNHRGRECKRENNACERCQVRFRSQCILSHKRLPLAIFGARSGSGLMSNSPPDDSRPDETSLPPALLAQPAAGDHGPINILVMFSPDEPANSLPVTLLRCAGATTTDNDGIPISDDSYVLSSLGPDQIILWAGSRPRLLDSPFHFPHLENLVKEYAGADIPLPRHELVRNSYKMLRLYLVLEHPRFFFVPGNSPEARPRSLPPQVHAQLWRLALRGLSDWEVQVLSELDECFPVKHIQQEEVTPLWICLWQLILMYGEVHQSIISLRLPWVGRSSETILAALCQSYDFLFSNKKKTKSAPKDFAVRIMPHPLANQLLQARREYRIFCANFPVEDPCPALRIIRDNALCSALP